MRIWPYQEVLDGKRSETWTHVARKVVIKVRRYPAATEKKVTVGNLSLPGLWGPTHSTGNSEQRGSGAAL